MSRLGFNKRLSPTDVDDITPTRVDYSFDHRRNVSPDAKSSWPEKFGPSNISKAWKNGLIVIGEFNDLPHPVAVTQGRWAAAGDIEVSVQGNWLVPARLFTRDSVKGLKSTGEYVEG